MAEQTRNPTSDEAVSGTWTGTPGSRYTVVDDYPDTGGTDELTHGTTAGNLTFGFSAFSIPAGSTNIQVHVDYYDYKNAAQNCQIGGRLKVNGSYYNATTHNPANGSRTQRTDSWTTNPDTGLGWTVDDVNGSGSNPLQAFGWVSSDANPTITLSSIQVRVSYDEPVADEPSATSVFVERIFAFDAAFESFSVAPIPDTAAAPPEDPPHAEVADLLEGRHFEWLYAPYTFAPIPDVAAGAAPTLSDVLGSRLKKHLLDYNGTAWVCELGSGNAAVTGGQPLPNVDTSMPSGQSACDFSNSDYAVLEYTGFDATWGTYDNTHNYCIGFLLKINSSAVPSDFVVTPGSNLLCYYNSSNVLGCQGSDSDDDLADDTWHRVILVKNGTANNVMYIDGVAQATTGTGNIGADMGNAYFGDRYAGNGGGLDGSIGSFFMARDASTAFSAQDISDIDDALDAVLTGAGATPVDPPAVDYPTLADTREYPWVYDAQIVAPVVDDPIAALSLTGWWRASFGAAPWVGTASAGPSGGRTLASGGNPPSAGTAVNGHVPASFDGANDYLYEATLLATSYVSASAYTIALLVKPTAASAPAANVYDNDQLFSFGTGYASLGLAWSTSGVKAWHETSSGSAWAETAWVPCSADEWHMLTVTYDGTQIRLTVDNVVSAVVSATDVQDLSSVTPQLGRNYNTTVFAQKDVLEVILASSALSAGNITTIKDSWETRYALTLTGAQSDLYAVYGASLARHWFEGVAAGVIVDDAGSGYSMWFGTAPNDPEAIASPASRTVYDFDADTSNQDNVATGTTPFPPTNTCSAQVGCVFRVDGSGEVSFFYASDWGASFSMHVDAGGNFIARVFGSEVSITRPSNGWHTCVIDIRGGSDVTTNPIRVYIDGTLAGQRTSACANAADTSEAISNFASSWYSYGSATWSAQTFAAGSWFIAFKTSDFTLDTDAQAASTVLQSYVELLTLTADTVAFTLTGNAANLLIGRRLVADSASFTLTGPATNLLWGHSLPAAEGAFALTGNDAALSHGYSVTAEEGAFTLTGPTANLLWGHSLTAQEGAFTLTGPATNLLWGHSLTADEGAFALTGNAAGLNRGYPLTADTGAFTLTGNAATLLRAVTIVADEGSFTLTGNVVNLLKGKTMAADEGAFTLTGNAANLLRALALVAAEGAFALTGQAANLLWGHLLTAQEGAFALTGNAAGLYRGYPLTADTGAFVLTGQAANLLWGHSLTAQEGAFVLTGNAAGLYRGYPLTADTGAFALTGQAANLLKGWAIAADTGVFTLTGNDANLYEGAPLLAETGVFALTGQAANLLWGHLLTAQEGAFTLTGNAANVFRTYPFTADEGSFTLTGNDAGVLWGRLLTADVGSFTLTGTNAGLTKDSPLTADTGAFVLTGQAANLLWGHLLTADVGSFALTGNDANLSTLIGIVAETGAFALTGHNTGVLWGRLLTADSGAFTVTGNAAGALWGRKVTADAGSFALTGSAANLLWGHLLTADTGAFALTGNVAGLLYSPALVAETGVFVLTGNDAELVIPGILYADTGAFTLAGGDAGLLTGHLLTADTGAFALTGADAGLTWLKGITAETGVFVLTGWGAWVATAPSGKVGHRAALPSNRVVLTLGAASKPAVVRITTARSKVTE